MMGEHLVSILFVIALFALRLGVPAAVIWLLGRLFRRLVPDLA